MNFVSISKAVHRSRLLALLPLTKQTSFSQVKQLVETSLPMWRIVTNWLFGSLCWKNVSHFLLLMTPKRSSSIWLFITLHVLWVPSSLFIPSTQTKINLLFIWPAIIRRTLNSWRQFLNVSKIPKRKMLSKRCRKLCF